MQVESSSRPFSIRSLTPLQSTGIGIIAGTALGLLLHYRWQYDAKRSFVGGVMSTGVTTTLLFAVKREEDQGGYPILHSSVFKGDQ